MTSPGPFGPELASLPDNIILSQSEVAEPNSYQKMFSTRQLDQRSRIEFHYGGEENKIIFLPFYENPKIKESQNATYAEYNPVGRAGSMYAYIGAKSRKFKIDMTYTLPHLAMHDMGIDRFMRVFSNQGPDAERLLFTSKSKYSPKPKAGDAHKSLSLAVEKMYWALREEGKGSVISQTQQVALADKTKEVLEGANPTDMHKILDTLLFFIAILRTSVTNKVNDPMVGPPLLRLTFGTLYQSVPCICKSYSLDWDENAGYHLETLTPRRLTISLTLEEVRVGDFTNYEPAKLTKRDNLTGWESAVNSPFTTDPLPAAGFWAGS